MEYLSVAGGLRLMEDQMATALSMKSFIIIKLNRDLNIFLKQFLKHFHKLHFITELLSTEKLHLKSYFRRHS